MTSIDARCPLPVHLLPPLFSHPTPSKRSVDSTSPNQRPVRRLSGLLSRGRSNLATSLRQTDEKPDKSTISLILFPHTCTRIFFFHSLSFSPSLLPSPHSFSHTLSLSSRSLHFAFLSLPPAAEVNNLKSCRHSYRLRARNPYRVSARSLEFAEPLAKMTIFLGHPA